MKIGFLCGSFDPIHIGHLHMITVALASNYVDKVIVIPTLQNPWKRDAPLPFDIRCAFIEDAIKPFGDKCELSRVEELVEGTKYFYKTSKILREQFKDDELYIIAGTDVVKQINNWKNYDEEIAPYFKIIEIARNNQCSHDPSTKDGSIILFAHTTMDVSSTLVRTMLQNGQNPYPYITSSIYNTIKTYKFYTDNQEEGVKKWFKNFKG